MKKLLFTAIAAAGVAFGLRAEALPTGTSFEGTTVTDPVDLDGQGEIATGSYWSIPTGDANQSLKVTAYGSDAKLTGDKRVGYYADQEASQNNYLAIKTTFGKPVTRNVYDAGAAETLVDGGIYFDSLVKMTVCDEAPAADTYTDAKILVWAQETAEGDKTNLWVRAGVVTVGTESTTVVPQDFNCGTVENADQWHRLTIKVIKDITRADGVPGFVVFWDKTAQGALEAKIGSSLKLNDSAATFDRDGCLFASLVQSGGNRDKISGVAFDGQGSVDDLLFTKDVPFDGAEDKEFFSIALGAKVTSFDYTVGSDTQTATNNTLVPYTAGMTISISEVKCEDGYMAGALTGDGVNGMNFVPTAKNQSGTVNAQAVGVKIGDEKFADLASAFTYLNETATGDVVMELKAALASGELASAITIDNANLTSVKIDLAGKTISCDEDAYVITTAVPLWITDSVGGGKIACTYVGESAEANGALYATAPVTIDAGIFDGDVLLGAEEGQGKTISGGSFKNVNGGESAADFPCNDFVADGYVAELINGYYVVSLPPKKGWAIYLAAGENENEFLINDEDDLIEIATNMHTTADFATEGITFKLNANIAMTKPFVGIGVGNAKDLVSWTLDTSKKDHITEEESNNRIAAFNAGAFKGTFDGNNLQITNLQLVKDDNHGDYAGFIQSALGATIKNLTIGVNSTSLFSPNTGDRGGAVIAGVTVSTTVENCTTLEGSVTVNKAESGIVGYACGGTIIKGCVNNLDITTSNEKVGGIVACAQKGASKKDGTLAFGDGTLVIEGCTNAGNLTCSTGNKEYTAGIASYGDIAITFKGVNSNTGTLTCTGNKVYSVCAQSGGSLTVAEGATFHVQANYKAVRTPCDGFNFGTVDGDWITFVKDAEVANGMRVMSVNAPVTLAAGASITLDQTVASPSVTVPAGYYDAITGSGAAVTHTATAKTDYSAAVLTLESASADWTDKLAFPTYTVTVGGVDVPAAAYTAAWNPAEIAEMKAGDADKVYTLTVTITDDGKVIPPAAALTKTFTVKAPTAPVIDPVTPGAPIDVPAGADPAEFLATVNANKEAYLKAPGEAETTAAYRTYFTAKLVENKVVFELNTAGEKALQDSANGEIVKVKPGDIAAGEPDEAGNITVAVENPIQGFYYAVKQGNGIGTMAVVDEGVLADGKAISLKYHQYKGAGFYSIVVSPTPITPEN